MAACARPRQGKSCLGRHKVPARPAHRPQSDERGSREALRHLRAGAPTLVLAGGPPGTGKSALAGAAAGRLAFTVLASDQIRTELAGPGAGQHTRAPRGHGPCPPGQAGRTYAELLRRASLLLARGESVIAGAPFASAGQRAAAAQAAAAASAGLVQLHCTTPPEPATRQASAQPGGAPGTCRSPPLMSLRSMPDELPYDMRERRVRQWRFSVAVYCRSCRARRAL